MVTWYCYRCDVSVPWKERCAECGRSSHTGLASDVEKPSDAPVTMKIDPTTRRVHCEPQAEAPMSDNDPPIPFMAVEVDGEPFWFGWRFDWLCYLLIPRREANDD